MKSPADTVRGRIVGYDERRQELLIRAPYDDWFTLSKRGYKTCLLQLEDSRPLSDGQRRFCYQLLQAIAEHTGQGIGPTKELMKLVLEQRIAHGGHPVLRWMMDNIFIRTDPAGNIKPDKEKSTEKIDGAVATIMALDRAIRCGNENGASVYDDRGILFI